MMLVDNTTINPIRLNFTSTVMMLFTILKLYFNYTEIYFVLNQEFVSNGISLLRSMAD